jgi:hypothetical protein
MAYYSLPWGGRATFSLVDQSGREIASIKGEKAGVGPVSLQGTTPTASISYPLFEVVRANGLIEIIEHRRMEPVFYINDDPTVRTALLSHYSFANVK